MNKTIIQIAALFKRRLPCWHSKSREDCLAYIKWHAAMSSMAYLEENGRVVAAGSARVVKDLADTRIPFKTDESGTIVYCENVVCKKRKFMPALLVAIKVRFPKVKQIVVHDRHGTRAERVFEFSRYFNLTKRLCHG